MPGYTWRGLLWVPSILCSSLVVNAGILYFNVVCKKKTKKKKKHVFELNIHICYIFKYIFIVQAFTILFVEEIPILFYLNIIRTWFGLVFLSALKNLITLFFFCLVLFLPRNFLVLNEAQVRIAIKSPVIWKRKKCSTGKIFTTNSPLLGNTAGMPGISSGL